MQVLIVDSSVIVKWLHQEGEEYIDQADAIMEEARSNQVELLAPELAKYEVGSAIYSLPIQFIDETEDIANETYKITHKAKITYYDASFLSLAKQYGATLVTDNIKHQGKQLDVKVIPLKSYGII